jgi:hypothetical protein
MKKENIKLFEANFLDGDSINDCGDVMFSVGGVIEIVDFFLNQEKAEIREMIEKIYCNSVLFKNKNEKADKLYLDIIRLLNK